MPKPHASRIAKTKKENAALDPEFQKVVKHFLMTPAKPHNTSPAKKKKEDK
jgi:hypothetical protein